MEAFLFNPEIFSKLSKYAIEINAINLSQGIPEPILNDRINEFIKASENIYWNYSDPRGTDLLRSTLCNEYKDKCKVNEILVTSGATESLYLALVSIKNKYGKKIGFFEPFYPSYPGLCQKLDMEYYALPMIKGINSLELDFNALEDFAKNGGRIIILNTPHNPTGWVLKNKDYQELKALINKYDLFIIIDEVYRKYEYIRNLEPIENLLELENVLICGSSSKLLSATGLRVGWLIGNPKIIENALSHHLYITYCQPQILQDVVANILSEILNDESIFENILNQYKIKRDILFYKLNEFGFDSVMPDGGHFIIVIL